MIKQNFNADWSIKKPYSIADGLKEMAAPPRQIHLPHDYMIECERKEDNPSGFIGGYYPTEDRNYSKDFFAPEDWKGKKVFVEFEGVYMNASVLLNGNYVGKYPYGYSNFMMDLTRFVKIGEKNNIRVSVKNGTGRNARWYSGAGIYRNVNLYVTDYAYIQLDGVKISTPVVKDHLAQIQIDTCLLSEENSDLQTYRLRTEICEENGASVGIIETPMTMKGGEEVTVHQKLYVKEPKLWTLERPVLYCYTARLFRGEKEIDRAEGHFGIRSIEFNPLEGFLLNGMQIKLRGACFHHDNGILGACSFEAAEERKVRLLKEAGFNALRSAHNPASRALLDVCDRMGMLVIDEAFDMWNISKTDHDYSMSFEEWWDKDIRSMVKKDYNHPSVIMYSIGNEIAERDGSSDGNIWARKLAECIRSIDTTRAVTNGTNNVSTFGGSMEDLISVLIDLQINGGTAEHINEVPAELFAEKTEEYMSAVDVAGYNYMHSRYAADHERFPERIICGTESMAAQIADIWKEVKAVPCVIGDFCWTGMDYIGEAGCGKINYSDNRGSFFGNWPWYLAYCGDIDLAGNRRPQSYYREIVWGLRKAPYIAVGRPEHYGEVPEVSNWSWRDVIESWTFPGLEEKPVKVEVYSDADRVELYCNDRLIGKATAGAEYRYLAEFDTVYEPGELYAVAYTDGKESGRFSIKTAGKAQAIRMRADCNEIQAGEEDISYLDIYFADEDGAVCPNINAQVTLTVSGAGTLQGCGSADPCSLENFYDNVTTTFDGRMLAAVRSGKEPGSIIVKAECEGYESAEIVIRTK